MKNKQIKDFKAYSCICTQSVSIYSSLSLFTILCGGHPSQPVAAEAEYKAENVDNRRVQLAQRIASLTLG